MDHQEDEHMVWLLDVLAQSNDLRSLPVDTVEQGCVLCDNNVIGNEHMNYYCDKCKIYYSKSNLIAFKRMEKMATALFVGRFQPFHKGHMEAILQILQHAERVIVGIGSSQYSRIKDNPFTIKEREDMIKLSLNGIPRDKIELHRIPDIHNSPKWVSHVEKCVPQFDLVFTANEEVGKLFNDKYDVRRLRLYLNISATILREKILKGEEWKKFVAPECAEYLEKIGARDILEASVSVNS